MGTRSLLARFRETDRLARRFAVAAGAVLFVLFALQQVFTYLGHANARNLTTLALVVTGGALGGYGFARIRRETRQFEREFEETIVETAERITTTARSLAEVSAQIESSASKLAGSSQAQTGSVQQSVETMSHISKALEQTSSLAGEGHQLGRQGLEEGFKGLDIIDRMIGAVEQLRESHQSLQSLVTLISTIREKTQIINDIVFETRLLSFNASIEAARAGENGKGFAVVAEHVGKLAEMSGQAALEINELLSSATTEVAEVVKVTRERVEVGAKVTIDSQGAFEAVNSAIMRISSTLEKIGQSARDQHDKVKGAVESMNGVSGLSLDHLESARTLSESSTQLVQESIEFQDSVSGLKSLVRAA